MNVFNKSLALELKMFCGRKWFQKYRSQKLLQILKFANFENGGTDIQRDILCAMGKILPTSSLLQVNYRSVYFEM